MPETILNLPFAQDEQLLQHLLAQWGFKPHECYQCGKCSAGCPLAAEMDAPPRRIMRYLQLGLTEEALHSSSLWLCLSCYTCSSRCPNHIEVAEIMADLRRQAEKRGICPLRRARLFNSAFMRPVKWFGRSHDITMTALYNISSGRILQHFAYLPGMIKGRQLKFVPSRVKDRAAIGRLLEHSLKPEDKGKEVEPK